MCPLTVMVALLLPFLPMAVDWPGERYTTRLAGKYCSSTPRALGGATNCTPQAPAQMRLRGGRLTGGAGSGRKGSVFCPIQAFDKGFAPSELSRAQLSTHLDTWTQKLYRLLQRRYNMKDSRATYPTKVRRWDTLDFLTETSDSFAKCASCR